MWLSSKIAVPTNNAELTSYPTRGSRLVRPSESNIWRTRQYSLPVFFPDPDPYVSGDFQLDRIAAAVLTG